MASDVMLKPCPNPECPKSSAMIEVDCGNDERVFCETCGASTGWYKGYEAPNGRAIAAWNQRTPATDGAVHTPIEAVVDDFNVASWIEININQRREWLAKCEAEVAAFEVQEHMEAFAQNWRLNRHDARLKLQVAQGLQDLLNDRDEWREQHENLLSVRQSDIAALSANREVIEAETLERAAKVADGFAAASGDGGGRPFSAATYARTIAAAIRALGAVT